MKIQRIQRVAVIGAGTMGSAIAQHFIMKGVQVLLTDANTQFLERGQKRIHEALEEAVQKKVIGPADKDAALGRLRLSDRHEALKDSELVVEAVFEDLEIKKELFKELEKHVSKDCVLASNTSSFLIGDIASGLNHPSRVVGIHYFYHAAKNKLVEIIPGPETAPAITRSLWNFYTACDKIPIIVQDAPGFAVNRFFVPWLTEATRLYEEGLGSIAFIDSVACKTFQVGMGPFGLMNATGVPIAYHAAQGLAERLGPFYAPARILNDQIQSGKPWDLSSEQILKGGSNNESAVRDRLLAATLGVAVTMVGEDITDATSTDLGARVGLRWPKGPFEMIEERGADKMAGLFEKFFAQWKLPVPKVDIQMQWVQAEIKDRFALIQFNIPDRMNPLGPEVASQLSKVWDGLEANSAIDTVFITGRGKAFMAGANISYFLEHMNRGDIDGVYEFTRFGQEVFAKIQNSKKRSVAYLNGLTLGGGLELALACRYRIASKKALLAFPETGIGIYPGLGGTQRTTRLVGKGLAKFLVATGQMVNAETALKYGLVDTVIDPPYDLLELVDVPLPGAPGKPKQLGLPEEGFASYDGSLSPETLQKPPFVTFEKLLKRKAPGALKTAMKLIDDGEKLALADAMALELKPLRDTFKTQDAKIGLSSVLNKTRPEFTGR